VHDKTVRRRRAVLALLVALSLILISASFGGSASGGLHTIQAGFLDILSPIESGANKVLTPVHDLFNAISDVFNAAGQRDRLRTQKGQLEQQLAYWEARARENASAAATLHLDSRDNLSADGPVTASVIAGPPTLFVNQLRVDAGSGSGVAAGDPAIADGALVGTVTQVAAQSATVTLIDDASAPVAGMDGPSGETGLVKPDPGNTSLLTFNFMRDVSKVRVGDQIVTAGWQATDHASVLPPNIPIGTVTGVPSPVDQSAPVTIAPATDLGAIGAVQILTRLPH
jgi:rod shape-determining protein MreC